jgi:hypothetical protein
MVRHHLTMIRRIRAGTWLWCLHCERCYQAGEYREINGLQFCPYEGCTGTTVLDGWRWSSVRENDHFEYPEIPERNVVYPLDHDT